MMEARLQSRVAGLARARRRARLARALALCWAGAAVLGLVLLALRVGNWLAPAALALVAIIAALASLATGQKSADDWRHILREIESESPAAAELLKAAAEQKPDAAGFTFLQWRVVEAAVSHPRWVEWERRSRRRAETAIVAQTVALLAFAGTLFLLRFSQPHHAKTSGGWLAGGEEITVTPGDTNIEGGTSLVVAARFGGAPPADAALVVRTATGKETRLQMARRLADPVFGASVPEVSEAAFYHIEYNGKKTRDYTVGVFEYPALTRADASLRYPAYTGLTNQTILDTRRVSAVEGSHLSYTLHLNKAVTRARWVGSNGVVAFAVSSNATASLPDFLLTNTATYRLELVDADGRANKFPLDFVLQALTNQRPVVRIVFPRGDPRVSKLQELQLQAEASDDFGLLKYGIGYGVAGQEPKFVELGGTAPANTRRQFELVVPLEKLDVEPDQSVSYFAWADDYGPDGRERRSFSDIFFADVRPFDEVFRADESGEDPGQSGGGQGGGDERVKLAETEKQIVIATWNLEKLGEDSPSHP